MRHIFIINPAAGQRDHSVKIKQEILEACEAHDIQPLIFISEYAGYEREMTSKMCSLFSNENIRFYSCGGSGTLAQVVSGIDHFDHAEVTCYPCGNSNNFVKYYDRHMKSFLSIEQLITGQVNLVDVMEVNGMRMLNLVGFGIKSRFFNPAEEYELVIDGKNFSGKYCFAACFNGPYTGGRFTPLPEATPTDGLMNVILAKDMSLLQQLRFYNRYAHNHVKRIDSSVFILEAKSISVSPKGGLESLSLYCDGERITAENRTTIDIRKRQLKFVVPEAVEIL